MRDSVERLIINALCHALSTREGLPLLASTSREGLFANTRIGKEAARACTARGLIQISGSERRGRTTTERYTLSEAGKSFLRNSLSQSLALLNDDRSSTGWHADVLTYLERRHETALNDCPLPTLYEIARRADGDVTLGQFHDGLRDLLERGQIYLHPWTGPLYDLPEPSLALLVGHEIVYYASLRFTCFNREPSASARGVNVVAPPADAGGSLAEVMP